MTCWADQRVILVVGIAASTPTRQSAFHPVPTSELVLPDVAALVVVGILIGGVETQPVDRAGVVCGERIFGTARLDDDSRGKSRGLAQIAAKVLLALRLQIMRTIWGDWIRGPATALIVSEALLDV